MDNVSIAQFYVEPAPQVCGDIPPQFWVPDVFFTFQRTQMPPYKRLRSRNRREDGPVFDSASSAVPVLNEWEGLGRSAGVDFALYDLWAVTGSFGAAPPPLMDFDADNYALMAAQYWASITPPAWQSGYAVDSGYSTAGPRVRLSGRTGMAAAATTGPA